VAAETPGLRPTGRGRPLETAPSGSTHLRVGVAPSSVVSGGRRRDVRQVRRGASGDALDNQLASIVATIKDRDARARGETL